MKLYKDKKNFYADPYLIFYKGDVYSTDGRGYMPNGIFCQLCEAKDFDKEKLQDDFEQIAIETIPESLKKTMQYCLGVNFNHLIKLR